MRPTIYQVKNQSLGAIVFYAAEHAKTRHYAHKKIGGSEKLETIMEQVCSVFGLTTRQLRSESREAKYTIPRHIYGYLAILFTSATLKQIGLSLNGRDHTTIIHSKKVIFNLLDTKDEKFFSYWHKWEMTAPSYLIP